jgi:Flp pilus assembly protein TadD
MGLWEQIEKARQLPRRCFGEIPFAPRPARLAVVALLCGCGIMAASLPGDAQATTLYQQAQAAFTAGDYSRAAELFGQAEAKNPGQSDALLLEGKALANIGKFTEADAALRPYAFLHRNSSDAFFMLGFVLYRENKPADSLREYTQAAALATPKSEDLRIVALDYVLLNDYPDAIRWLEKATAFDPQNEQAWYSLGRCYYTQSRFADAERALQQALHLNQQDAKAVTNLALTYEMDNKIEDADRTYRRSIELADADAHTDEWPYLNYASFLLEHDRASEALPLLRRAVAMAAGCADCHAKLGRALAATGNPKGAVAELSQAVTLSPDDPKLHYALGHVYQSLGMQDKAKSELAISARLYGNRDSVGPQ